MPCAGWPSRRHWVAPWPCAQRLASACSARAFARPPARCRPWRDPGRLRGQRGLRGRLARPVGVGGLLRAARGGGEGDPGDGSGDADAGGRALGVHGESFSVWVATAGAVSTQIRGAGVGDTSAVGRRRERARAPDALEGPGMHRALPSVRSTAQLPCAHRRASARSARAARSASAARSLAARWPAVRVLGRPVSLRPAQGVGVLGPRPRDGLLLSGPWRDPGRRQRGLRGGLARSVGVGGLLRAASGGGQGDPGDGGGDADAGGRALGVHGESFSVSGRGPLVRSARQIREAARGYVRVRSAP